MFCSKCGKEINDSSKFCRFCGAKLDIQSPSSSDNYEKKKHYYHSYPIPTMISSDLHDRSEEFYFECRPSLICFNFVMFFLCTFLFIISLYLILVDTAFLAMSSIIIVGLVLLLFISVLQWKHTIYALTTKRVLRISGVIGKNIYENKLNRVQDVRLRIGIFQRMVGCGDITITTAGTAGVECVWKGIKEPKKIQEMLRRLID